MLVTGASSGIGAACARAFAAEGAHVLVHFNRGEDRAQEIADDIGGMPTAQADLTVEADADRLFEEARAALGSVDVCAAIAGVYPSDDAPVWALSLERWEATLRASRTATFPTARGFLREVESTGTGSLVTSQVVAVAGGMEGRLVHAGQEPT